MLRREERGFAKKKGGKKGDEDAATEEVDDQAIIKVPSPLRLLCFSVM